MTLKPLFALILAGACLFTASPAEAVTYGGWNARITFASWLDDNLARGLTVGTDVLPYGNQDYGGRLGLTLGNVFVLTPDVDLWLIASGSGTRGILYPTLGAMWGSLFAQTLWHLDGGREAFVLLGSTSYGSTGTYHAGEVGFVQPVWSGAAARIEAGVGRFLGSTAGTGFTMPSISTGLDQAFSTGTLLGARYAFQLQSGEAATAPRHQLYLIAQQRLIGGLDVHAHYLATLDSSSTAGYRSGYADFGLGYDF